MSLKNIMLFTLAVICILAVMYFEDPDDYVWENVIMSENIINQDMSKIDITTGKGK